MKDWLYSAPFPNGEKLKDHLTELYPTLKLIIYLRQPNWIEKALKRQWDKAANANEDKEDNVEPPAVLSFNPEECNFLELCEKIQFEQQVLVYCDDAHLHYLAAARYWYRRFHNEDDYDIIEELRTTEKDYVTAKTKEQRAQMGVIVDKAKEMYRAKRLFKVVKVPRKKK